MSDTDTDAADDGTGQFEHGFQVFCSINESAIIPEICNEFILHYCQDHFGRAGIPDQQTFIQLTEHMCTWLME